MEQPFGRALDKFVVRTPGPRILITDDPAFAALGPVPTAPTPLAATRGPGRPPGSGKRKAAADPQRDAAGQVAQFFYSLS